MELDAAAVALVIALTIANAAAAKDQSKQDQIGDNTARIEQLEARTTLSDLSCATDEIAAFDGANWDCASPALPLSFYFVRRPVSLESHPTLPQTVRWDAFCSPGDLAVAGGWETPPGSFSYRVVSSHRSPNDERVWSTSITVAPNTITLGGAVHATCLDSTP